ncbi:MAG: PAS domain S-box protein, partial [Fidelibacterota bacterium]
TEQKQVQEKLKAAQEFSRNIIDSSLNMIITVDRHRHITEFNPAAEHTFGYTREEILGKHINILYAKLEQGRQVHRKTMESGQHVQDVLNKRKNGKVFPAVLASSTLVTSQGKLVGVMGISRDISEQTIALDRLKESEEQFRSMTNTATDAIIGLDEKGTIQVWNPAAAQLFGYTEKEALEKNLHDLIVPTYYRKQARSALKEFYKTGKGRMLGKTIELTGLKKNGKEFPVELSISSYKRQGKWQATGVIRDITERKEADDLLKLSETKFRTLFEESNDTIYITSLDGKIIDMNPAGEELFRYTREELLKMKAQELYVFPEERKVFQQTMREKGSARNYELRLKRKDGVLRNCLVSASPWKDNTGKLIGYQGIIHDVTEELLVQNELKEALLKAQEADRVKSLFLANMSHEIRTPLNTVLGFTELVEHTVKDQIPAEEQGFFKTIRTSGKRLSHTIHEILNISQIEAGTFQTHLKEHNLVEMLEIAIMPLKSQAAEKGLEFTSRSTIAEAPVYVDEYCVIQAISNVVENAIKYTPKGKVEVILNGARNTFNVRVTDTGEGIAKKNLNDIFKEFKQESEGYTKKYQGVGLGLALVKRYLEICRADIEVKSEKGAGSTFILKFPKWRGKKHKGG